MSTKNKATPRCSIQLLDAKSFKKTFGHDCVAAGALVETSLASSKTWVYSFFARMATNEIEITCYLIGEKQPFSVVVPRNISIPRLRAKIREEKPNRLAKVDANELLLWLVRFSPDKDLQHRASQWIKTNEIIHSTTTTISDFPDLDAPNTVRILVGIPDNSEITYLTCKSSIY